MRVLVRYFAVFRERLGCDQEPLELQENTTVGAALATLAVTHPPIAALAGRYQVAVNQTMATMERVLCDGDELVLIPPVAGGQDRPARLARICDGPVQLQRVIDAVTRSSCGAIATFSGVVRDHSGGRAVSGLEYEAYSEMATSVLAAICTEIEAQIPGVLLAVEHRVGALAVGEPAVVIAAAAPHRAQAFAACQQCIDELKARAPIWKREVGPGGTEWVGLGP